MLDDLILEVKWLAFDIITKNLLIAIELTGSEKVICPLKISLEIDLYNWNANKSIQFCSSNSYWNFIWCTTGNSAVKNPSARQGT